MANLKDTTVLGNLMTTGDVIVAGSITENGQALSEKYALKGEAGGGTSYSEATQTAAGLMSAEDKKKLDGIATSANNYTLPTATDTVLGGIRLKYNSSDKSLIIYTTKA